MGVVEFSATLPSSIPAPKLFKAYCIDSHAILTKIAPDHVKSVQVEGSIGVGAIVHITFTDVVPLKFVKFKIDVLDENTLTFADTVVEGGELTLSDKILKVTHELKFESSPEGGCSVKSVATFHLKEGTTLAEDEVKGAKEGAIGLFKAVEAYTLAN